MGREESAALRQARKDAMLSASADSAQDHSNEQERPSSDPDRAGSPAYQTINRPHNHGLWAGARTHRYLAAGDTFGRTGPDRTVDGDWTPTCGRGSTLFRR